MLDARAAAKAYSHSVRKMGFKAPEGHKLIEEWQEITYHPKAIKFKKFAAIVELLDLALSLRQFVKERSTVNDLTMARSMADTSALLLEFAHGTKGKALGALLATRG